MSHVKSRDSGNTRLLSQQEIEIVAGEDLSDALMQSARLEHGYVFVLSNLYICICDL